MILKKHFLWRWQKNRTCCQNKVWVCSKRPKIASFNTLKLFSAKLFIIFCHIHKNCVCKHFLIFSKTKVFVNFKLLCLSKKQFSGVEFDPTYRKKLNFHPIFFWVIFSYISAHWCSQSFFPFWTAYLPWTETLFLAVNTVFIKLPKKVHLWLWRWWEGEPEHTGAQWTES